MSLDEAVAEEIIKRIKHHELSATQVSDCIGKDGVMAGVHPLQQGIYPDVKIGRVFFAYVYNESNWELHEQIHGYAVKPGDIVVVEQHNFGDRSVFGELVSTYLCKSRGASAVVVNGLVRDSGELRSRKFPVWCKGATPKGAFNVKNKEPIDAEVLTQWKAKYDGAIAVCDEDGVTIIPSHWINKDFLRRLDHIKGLETTWFNCVEEAGLSTYDTVCLKKYMKDPSLLPEALRKRVEELGQFAKDVKW
jgi:regulator of RNase E activity RraA